MRKISLILGLILAFAVLSQVSMAQDEPKITVNPIDDSINLNEIAEFEVIFENPTTRIFEYRFSTPDSIKWSIYTRPISSYIVKLYPGKTEKVTFHVDPLYVETAGQYGLRFDFLEVNSNQVVSKNVIVEITGEGSVEEYIPSFKYSLGIPESVDPREPLIISLNISNIVPLHMRGVKVLVDGNTFQPVTKVVDIESLGFKEIQFEIDLDDRLPPQEDQVTAAVSYFYPANNRTYHRPPQTVAFEIQEYSEVTMDKDVEKGFMSSSTQYTLFNDGNVEATGKVLIPYNWLGSFFKSMDEDLPRVKGDDGKTYYEWSTDLQPGQTKNFGTSSNYRPILYFLIVVALLVIAYYTFRSPILIEKFAVHIAKKGEEGISEIKIKLHLKNRTGLTFENVKLIDKIPKIADLASSFHVGTIKPDKILKHASKSTFLTWELPTLEGFEERIITYKINSKLKIIGGLRLPSALVKFKSSRLGRIKVESNNVLLRE